MSYTNKTEFYEIPLPIETDLYDPMDYNTSMEAVDTALHGAVQNASTAVSTANSASDAAAAATSGLEALSETVNTEKGKLTALTARVTAAENEIDDVRSDDEDMICAYNEPSATSAHAYAVGDFFIYNNVLYKATDAIAIGDTIVPNTNCAATNVTTEVDAINTALSGKSNKGTSINITAYENVTIADGKALLDEDNRTVKCQGRVTLSSAYNAGASIISVDTNEALTDATHYGFINLVADDGTIIPCYVNTNETKLYVKSRVTVPAATYSFESVVLY